MHACMHAVCIPVPDLARLGRNCSRTDSEQVGECIYKLWCIFDAGVQYTRQMYDIVGRAWVSACAEHGPVV